MAASSTTELAKGGILLQQMSTADVNGFATNGGRYNYVRKINSGCFGVVFQARDVSSQIVAIKLLGVGRVSKFKKVFGGSRAAERGYESAKEEARKLKELGVHKSIIECKDSFPFETNEIQGVAIVMPFCSKGNLEGYLNRGRLTSVATRLRWFQQLAEALEFVHIKKHMVHRDLKPDNVLIASDDSLKLADIGLVKVFDAWDPTMGVQYATSNKGNDCYKAPEVFNQTYDTRSDVFGLGLLFVAIITGNPYPTTKSGEPLGELLFRHKDLERIPASQLISFGNATPEETQLIQKMLVKDYHDRSPINKVVKDLKSLNSRQ